MSANLGREQILNSRASWPRRAVEVPELGGVVHVRSISLAELDRLNAAIRALPEGSVAAAAHFAIACACDEAGAPLFGPEDAELVAGVHHGALTRIAEAGMDLNGFRPEAEADRKNA